MKEISKYRRLKLKKKTISMLPTFEFVKQDKLKESKSKSARAKF